MRLCLFEDLFLEVLLALFHNKLKNILIILVFNFVDLFWTVAPLQFLFSLFVFRLRILPTLAAQKVILELLLFFLIGYLTFDHGRPHAAIVKRGHAIRIAGSAIFGIICVWFIVDCASFHISLLWVSSFICVLALDLRYCLELVIHVFLNAARVTMLVVWIHSDHFIVINFFIGRISVNRFLGILCSLIFCHRFISHYGL